MDTHSTDIVVIGAGIAGASAAAHLAADHRVALIEAEEVAGYHTTGRSAAMWILNYGPPDVRVLTGASRDFFENSPEGFADVPLMHRRACVFLSPREQEPVLAGMLAEGLGLHEIALDDVHRMVPALRSGWAVRAAIEDDSFDMDVATLHQGFLRLLRHRGGALALRSRSQRIERREGRWHVETPATTFVAPVVVNAAGAWGDKVAAQAGIRPLGLQPKRRTGVIIDPAPYQVEHWPVVHDAAHSWYARTEARTRLMVTPCDETDMPPHDVQPDELDIAIAIDRMQQALDIPVKRVERAWAGLRTFTPDRSLALGWAGDAEGFFWCVGQGGYGIQTSPAAGRLVADLVSGRDPGHTARILGRVDPRRFTPGLAVPSA
jgi:D-arginine dehydrogenase